MRNSRYLAVGLTMLMAASLALALTPRLKMADQEQKIDLETMIPRLFGKWRQQDALESLVISPDLKNELDRIYSQTLTRNYINDQGERVMLSIAYGSDLNRPGFPRHFRAG